MAQNPRKVGEVLKSLEAGKNRKGGKKGFSCKKSTFKVAGSNITVDSWRLQDWDYKRDDLPTYARGLFTAHNSKGEHEIVVRGYDKFFNVGEVRATEWQNVEQDTIGPYELSVKENGCIIFISGLEDGTLLVCSKHSTGARQDTDLSHAIAGEKWVKQHLRSVDKTTEQLARELRRLNVTAVAELCDDAFEEHVLEYPPETAGLYLHGINLNLPEFETLSGPEVHQFADEWGFKKAQYLIIRDLGEVQKFLEQCADTGSWAGRDTEGFVVRCHRQGDDKEPHRSWFFKYKFEEPYLMYRQWRENTKAVIAGRPPKIKKHKKITEQYLLYARKQLAKNPKLGKEYNQNHGIIAMRDGFLAEIGRKGTDIVNEEKAEDGELSSQDIVRNVVLVPVASIGCGKTTVALALVKLFGFGHVQNDNIEGKGNRPKRFALGLTNSLSENSAVIADRNNHQRRERKQIIDDVSQVIPDAKYVAFHYVHEPKDVMLPQIRRVTQQRVLERGDNHQTIRAGSKSQGEIIGIMEGFLSRFEGIDPDRDPDNGFDEVIDLDVAASSLENLEKVIESLHNAYPKLLGENLPSHADMEDAIDYAMKSYMVETKHDLSFGNKSQKTRGRGAPTQNAEAPLNLRPDQLVQRLEYFGITVSTTVINSMLNVLFAKASSEEGKTYHLLKQSRRLQLEFHVTLIHRASADAQSDIWTKYTEIYKGILMSHGKENRTPSLGPARIRLERLVWDDRVMAFVVRILPPQQHQVESGEDGCPCANPIPHVTVGTASPDVKPKESNDLLKRWSEGDTGGNKIWEMEVPGLKILEGTIRPVMQRGK